jgi:hypothetical protein
MEFSSFIIIISNVIIKYFTNNTVECIKDLNTYLITPLLLNLNPFKGKVEVPVREEGQQPVLKRIMRLSVGLLKIAAKIDLTVNGLFRMRVNSQNSSYFGHDSAVIWNQHLHISLSSLKVKIYFVGYSKTETLLIAFRTDNKRVSYIITSSVICATGEALYRDILYFHIKGGRGSVVPPKDKLLFFGGKGPKYLVSLTSLRCTRSYSTRSVAQKLDPVEGQSKTTSKGYEVIAKH